MSNTAARDSASASVSRSNNSQPTFAAYSRSATKRFRGDSRELPLPWAKSTTPTGSRRQGEHPRQPAVIADRHLHRLGDNVGG